MKFSTFFGILTIGGGVMDLIKTMLDGTNLTKNEKKICEGIFTYHESLGNMRSRELASLCHVSAATIIRLCQKLGFEGFQDFKMQFLVDYKSYQALNFDIQTMGVKKYDTTYEIMQKMNTLTHRYVDETFKEMDFKKVDKVVHLMIHAKQVDLYGMGLNKQLLEIEKYQLMRLGIPCLQEESRNARFSQALHSDSSHVAIIISHRGNTKDYLYIAYKLKEKGTPIIVLCGDLQSPLAKLADVCIYINPGNEFSDMATLVFKVSVNYVLDTIFACVYARKEDSIQKQLDDFEKLAHYTTKSMENSH